MDANFGVFFYSCANKKGHPEINNWLSQFLKLPFLATDDKTLIQYTLDCGELGVYPSWDYYSRYFPTVPDHKCSLGELGVAFKRIVEYYRRQRLVRELMEAASTTEDSEAMLSRLRSIVSSDDVSTGDVDWEHVFDCWTYENEMQRPLVEGIKIGVPEIDDLTNGGQGGSIMTIAGFTGSGKSISCMSTLYRAASKGKKCLCITLELPVKQLWLMLEARYMYEVHGIRLNYSDLMHHKLSGEKKAKVLSLEKSWRESVAKNICIVGSELFPKEVMMDVALLRERWAAFDRQLGGLDLVVLDHVGQLQLMYTERGQGLGNAIIVKLRQSILSFVTSTGDLPCLLFACQTNRDGYARAVKNGGAYDMRAISDLNEVERSSSYVIFIYTEPTAGETQECKFCMLKHRFGAPLPTPVVASFLPAVVTVGETVEAVTLGDEFAGMDGMEFGGGGSSDLTSDVAIDF